MAVDLTSLPILRVYIDETGDRGFGANASKTFGFCAVLVPDEDDQQLRAAVSQLRGDFGISTGRPVHWVEHLRSRHHDRRRHAAKTLADVPGVTLVFCMIDKQNVPAQSGMRQNVATIYNYATRLLFERIAFAARDWSGGTRRAVIKIAHVRGHDHGATSGYVQNACPAAPSAVSVPWHLVTGNIEVTGQANYDGLQAADLYAGMFNAAMTPDGFGNSTPEYLLTCGRQIRRGPGGQILQYGIKVLGNQAIVTSQDWWPQLGE